MTTSHRDSLDLQFATGYVYSPTGESDVSQRSRLMCARVKNGSQKWLKCYVARMRQDDACRFNGFFREHTLLVPVPQCRSGTLPSFWVARRLAHALLDAGLGEEVWPGLRRIAAVDKSASAWRGKRPTVQQHYQSFAVIPSPRTPSDIVLIDDVITKGRTAVAAAVRLQEAFPSATIRVFALVRTMGLVMDVRRLFDPCEGSIHWNGDDVHRDP
jgi:predicted amidophosphoribosyltransferase